MKRLHRLLSVTLIVALVLEQIPIFAQATLYQHPLRSSNHLFGSEALSVAAVSNLHFPLNPFQSFSRLKDSSFEWAPEIVSTANFLIWLYEPTIGVWLVPFSLIPILMAFAPSNGGSAHPLSERALQAAQSIYRSRPADRARTDLQFSELAQNRYDRYAEFLQLQPDPDVQSAAILILASDKDLKNIKLFNQHEKQRLLAIVHRVRDAFRIPYNLPDFTSGRDEQSALRQKKYPLIHADAISNQMGQIGKTLLTSDELLLVLAMKMSALQTTKTSEIRNILYREIQEVFLPLLSRLGSPRLATMVSEEAFKMFDPTLYEDIEIKIAHRLGMSRESAESYQLQIARDIQHSIPENCKVIAISLKNAFSANRKLTYKPADYPTIERIQDLLRFSVILNQRSDLESVVAQIASHFEGTSDDIEVKKLPGYNAFHITFIRDHNDISLHHEFHIFSNKEEYHRYHFGPQNPSWAYGLKYLFGRMPEFEAFEVKENDIRDNFQRYLEKLKENTYFSILDISGDRVVLVPAKIPHVEDEKRPRGNIADAAVSYRQLNKFTSGAFIKKRSFDAYSNERSESGRQAALDYVLRDRDIVQFFPAHHRLQASDPILQRAVNNASTLATAVEIRRQFEDGFDLLVSKGKTALQEHVIQTLGLPRRGHFALSESICKYALDPFTKRLNVMTRDGVWAALSIPVADPFMRQQQDELFDDILSRLRDSGSIELRNSGVRQWENISSDQLKAISESSGIPIQSKEHLALAVGAGFLQPSAVSHALLKVEAPIKTDSSPTVQLIPLVREIRAGQYSLHVKVSHDQPGIMAALLQFLAEKGWHADIGTRIATRDKEVYHFIPFNTKGKTINTRSLEEEIKQISIPQKETLTSWHPFRVSVRLHPSKAATNAFIQEFVTTLADMNLISFSMDDDGWLEMLVAIPIHDSNAERAAKRLHSTLLTMQQMSTIHDAPLIQDFEISDNNISEIQAARMLLFLKTKSDTDHKIRKILSRLQLGIQDLTRGSPTDKPCSDLVRAYALAEGFHEGEFRKSRKGGPYIGHPHAVTAKLIDKGVRDHATLIAAILHDAPENYPRHKLRAMKQEGAVTQDDEIILNQLRHEVMTQLDIDFPHIKHQLSKILGDVTYYQEGTLKGVFQRLTLRGDHNATALKLSDMEHNLESVFEVDTKKHSTFNPVDQIAKRLRFGLYLVIQETIVRDHIYTTFRREFLRRLILQFNGLKDDDAVRHVFLERNESYLDVAHEIILTLDGFSEWRPFNQDSFPMDLSKTIIDEFDRRLGVLRAELQRQIVLDSEAKRLPTLLLKEYDHPASQFQKTWFQGTELADYFNFELVQNSESHLEGRLWLLKPVAAEASLSITADPQHRIAYVPTLPINPSDIIYFRKHYPDLIRTILLWLRNRGFEEAHLPYEQQLLDYFTHRQMSPTDAAIVITPSEDKVQKKPVLRVHLNKLNLAPRPKSSNGNGGVHNGGVHVWVTLLLLTYPQWRDFVSFRLEEWMFVLAGIFAASFFAKSPALKVMRRLSSSA